MEKLIKLLNEYSSLNWLYYLEWVFVHDVEKDVPHLHYTAIISKEFWFIKWLVDNDKIDYKKDWKNSNDTWYIYVKADSEKSDLEIKSDTLLMVLSIQDNPIEFLVSILK